MQKIRLLSLLALLLVSLTACPGGGSAQPSVKGQVLDPGGQPVAGLQVYVAGSTAVLTDSNGKFSLTGAAAPYTLSLVDTRDKQALTLVGLTRLEPTIVFSTRSTRRETILSGSLGGPGYVSNPPPGYGLLTAFKPAGSSDYAYSPASGSPPPNTYDNRAYWYGPPSTQGTLYGLQWEKNPDGSPKGYKGFGSVTALTLSDGSPSTANLTLNPVGAQTLSGNVSLPAGYTLQQRNLYLRFDSTPTATYAGIQFFATLDKTASFSYPTPDIAGALFGVDQSAVNGPKYLSVYAGNLAGNASVSLDLNTAPQQLEPADGATGVTNATLFKWGAVPGAVYALNVYGVGGLNLTVLTSAPQATLPDLSTLSFPLPKNSPRSWSVTAYGPVASLDAAASASGWQSAPSQKSAGGLAFTTAP